FLEPAIKELLVTVDGEVSAAEQFHDLTVVNSLGASPTPVNDELLQPIRIHYKTYPRMPALRLNPTRSVDGPLAHLLQQRQSCRAFTGGNISSDQLSAL